MPYIVTGIYSLLDMFKFTFACFPYIKYMHIVYWNWTINPEGWSDEELLTVAYRENYGWYTLYFAPLISGGWQQEQPEHLKFDRNFLSQKEKLMK